MTPGKISKNNITDLFCITDLSQSVFSLKTRFLILTLNVIINPLQPGVAYLYPLKTSENLKHQKT